MRFLAVFLVVATVTFSEQAGTSVFKDTDEVANANNKFTAKFAQYLHSLAPGKNTVFSPVSATTVVAGLAEGAVGSTRSQLLSALDLEDNDQLIRSGYRTIMTSYDSIKSNVTLNIANAFFISDMFKPKESFTNVIRSDFKSEVEVVNFLDGNSAVDEINGWASEHTNGRIHQLYTPGGLSPDTLLVLANAVYFKGTWRYTFDNDLTKKQQFHVSSSETVDVDMMNTAAQLVGYSDDTLQANVLHLPYTGGEMEMVIVLPYEIDGLSKTIKNMQSIPKLNSDSIFTSLYTVDLPKFKITANIDVEEMLKSFGVTVAFTSAANFSQLSSEDISVESVVQQAFLEVNEKGTEAAAATGGGGWGPAPAPQPVPVVFRVDHPFLYFIMHGATDTAVFAGFVVNPNDI